jgi:hypothetical protein
MIHEVPQFSQELVISERFRMLQEAPTPSLQYKNWRSLIGQADRCAQQFEHDPRFVAARSEINPYVTDSPTKNHLFSAEYQRGFIRIVTKALRLEHGMDATQFAQNPEWFQQHSTELIEGYSRAFIDNVTEVQKTGLPLPFALKLGAHAYRITSDEIAQVRELAQQHNIISSLIGMTFLRKVTALEMMKEIVEMDARLRTDFPHDTGIPSLMVKCRLDETEIRRHLTEKTRPSEHKKPRYIPPSEDFDPIVQDEYFRLQALVSGNVLKQAKPEKIVDALHLTRRKLWDFLAEGEKGKVGLDYFLKDPLDFIGDGYRSYENPEKQKRVTIASLEVLVEGMSWLDRMLINHYIGGSGEPKSLHELITIFPDYDDSDIKLKLKLFSISVGRLCQLNKSETHI